MTEPVPQKLQFMVQGPERTCGGCHLQVIFAKSPDGMVRVMHKNPPCEGFEKFKNDPPRLMKYLETGSVEEAGKVRVPNRRERRRHDALKRKAAKANA